MQLLEISDPGFYVIHEGDLVEVASLDMDWDEAVRILALKIHLDDFTSSMTIDDNHLVTVGACTKYQGVGPDEAREVCDTLRKALVEAESVRCAPGSVAVIPDDLGRVEFEHFSVEMLRVRGYKDLEELLTRYNPESLKIGLHTVLNTLYFLTSDDDKDINLTYREAWDRVAIKDRRTPYGTCSSEWLVLTDDEADDLWDESLDNYIDECLEIPPHLENYIDREAFKRDARRDGRGHALSSYDGGEYSVEVDDQSFCLFRTN